MRLPVNHGFYGLEYCVDYDNYSIYIMNNVELYYDYHKKLWVHKKEYTGSIFPAIFPCNSLKAAKRHLKKHDEIPKGTKFRLVSKFVDGDIYLYKK